MAVRLNLEISNDLDFKIKTKILQINKNRKKDEKIISGREYITSLLEKDLEK